MLRRAIADDRTTGSLMDVVLLLRLLLLEIGPALLYAFAFDLIKPLPFAGYFAERRTAATGASNITSP